MTPTGVTMPEMKGSVTVGFGVGMRPPVLAGSGKEIAVVFEHIELFELR